MQENINRAAEAACYIDVSQIIWYNANKKQIIYVYCRSGRRSKEAAAKLIALGYTNVIECGGIIDWTGDLEN